ALRSGAPVEAPSRQCRYCCKSPKLPGANFPAVKKSDRRPPIDVASITLPGSPASFSSDNEVPHIFTWKSPVQPKEILIASAKRLLQQNLHSPDADENPGVSLKIDAERPDLETPHGSVHGAAGLGQYFTAAVGAAGAGPACAPERRHPSPT